MLEIKNTRTEMKNDLWTDQQTGLCPLVDEAHQQTVERIRTMKIGKKKHPELKYKQKKKAEKNRTEHPKIVGQIQKV